MAKTQAGFLGQGFPVPLRLERGEIAPVRDEEKIKQGLYVLLMTRQGERPLLPEFGSRIWDYVFELPSQSVRQMLCDSIRQTVLQWEHRVENVEVTIDSAELSQGCIWISVGYLVHSTNHPGNLTFPFYLEEGQW